MYLKYLKVAGIIKIQLLEGFSICINLKKLKMHVIFLKILNSRRRAFGNWEIISYLQ